LSLFPPVMSAFFLSISYSLMALNLALTHADAMADGNSSARPN
jgi:hypothetical protein